MRIRKDVLNAILEHAKAEAPIEACGYLAGNDGVAVEAIALTNVDKSPEHFSLDPKEQFAAVKRIRVAGLKLLAVYHSHPASPARPSQEDIRLAFDPSIGYTIVSLAGAEPDIKLFVIRDGIATREKLEVVENVEESQHVL